MSLDNTLDLAAAPDYDAAARAYVRWVERSQAEIPPAMFAAMEAAFGTQLRAAIAKADGNDDAPRGRS